jgi:Undecaprenyl-phosphate glucose phosphotransferase
MILRLLVDLTAIAVAWVVTFFFRFYTFFPVSKGIPDPTRYLKLLPFIMGIYLIVFSLSGLYRRTGNHRSAFVEGLDIIQSSLIGTLAFVAFSYFYDEYRYSRLVVIIFSTLQPTLMIGGRSVVRKALRYYRRKSDPRKLLIIGSGDALRHAFEIPFHNELQKTVLYGIMPIGNPEQMIAARKEADDRNYTVIVEPVDWTDFFSANSIDSVVLALPHSEYGFLDTSLEVIANQVADIKVLPDLARFTRFSPGIELVDGVPVISIHESPLAGWGSVGKRILDIVGASAGLLLFSPIMILTSIIVRTTSRGPILYAQDRMGLDGKTFRIYKFRSMPVDAERSTGAVWATADDNRPTKIGAIMRKTNIDELPQFFNVLRGDMSLVGPRPERPIFVDKFRRVVPGYMLRHKVKAGMTGWAQIKGWRGNTSIERRIECDLYYIQNWSIWLDFKILLLTILKSFMDKNAY